MKPDSRIDPTVDLLHGVEVRDPYRWLENEEDPEVREWVGAQNARTREILEAFPGRAALRARLEGLLSVGSVGTPVVRGGRLFYTRREGTANQPVLVVAFPTPGPAGSGGGPERVLLDPNLLSADGTTALDWFHPSRDGRLLAYGTSAGGSELSTLRIRDVDTGADLDDVIPDTRACSLAWEPSGRGFYYTRYPAPGSVPAGQEKYHRRVFHHTLGADPAADQLVFGEGREPDEWPNVDISPDGRWLVVTAATGWTRTDLFLLDLGVGEGTALRAGHEGSGERRPPGVGTDAPQRSHRAEAAPRFVTLVEGRDALYAVEPLEDRLIILTNEGAPNYRVFVADPSDPARDAWRELIPEGSAPIQSLKAIGGRIFAEYLEDASSRLRIFALEGSPEGEVPLPALGSILGLGGEIDGREAYVGFTSFTIPPGVLRCDLESRRLEWWRRVEAPVDPGAYEISQQRCTSRDGTSIPIFIVHRRGLARDGRRPLLLGGYGGFNVSNTPAYDKDAFVWLDRGGVLAIANLRGGGEYGEAWHRAGMLERKQNVFDDFLAAAEHLIRAGYTSPDRLAIQGGSNGGLLVGAALTQRPDLFRAAVCSVPLLDMLRYHLFQIARLWIPEYGSAEDPAQLPHLLAYSPYHRVRDGVAYPAVLLMTAEQDSRVDPMHARKMAARLQAAQGAGDRPILLRVEMKAGHGAGKPLSKQLDELTDVWSFLFRELAVEIDPQST